MKLRRGSLFYGTHLETSLLQFQVGDIVKSVFIGKTDFYGVVTEVNRKENKVYVNWNGSVKQHDPEEIQVWQVEKFSRDRGNSCQ